MKIKIKLFLGVGLLFAMILLLTILSSVFIAKLQSDTKNILTDNYKTLDYTREMLVAISSIGSNKSAIHSFELSLRNQQNNITENGEKELTQKLSDDFTFFKQSLRDSSRLRIIINDIDNIMQLNMRAINRKSVTAGITAKQATLRITLTGGICFLIAFTLLINLPGNIANPIKKLTDSIKEIASENYSQRVHFLKHNEFGELSAAFNTMAEKLEEYKAGNMEKLMIEKMRIEKLINNMNDPVIGLDEKMRIIFMNDVALKIAGLQAENTLGKKVQDIAVQNDLIRSLIRDLFDEGQELTIRKNIPVKIYADNKESYFEKEIIPISIIPTGEKTEKLIGNVILLQNVTPYKELDFAKTNFIATVSHELKTPISSIKMSLQLLENEKTGKVNTEQLSLLESIKDDAARLLKITGELLNMTELETGSIQLLIKPAIAKDILDLAMDANRISASQKNINLTLDYPPDTPHILADTEKTTWVLNNLISNAIRYSYENSKINLSVDSTDETVNFYVKDDGQGIAPQYLNKIFDRYFRIPETKKEGTGLGLSISKEFIEAQHGNISVISDFGVGSTFKISLPICSS